MSGNDPIPASQISPAHVVSACTIGNSNKTDEVFRGFNNPPPICVTSGLITPNMSQGASAYGGSVKLFAPGTDILSTWKDSNQDPNPCIRALSPVFPNSTVRDPFRSLSGGIWLGLLSHTFAGYGSVLSSLGELVQQPIKISTRGQHINTAVT
jgi:hypothetical protein